VGSTISPMILIVSFTEPISEIIYCLGGVSKTVERVIDRHKERRFSFARDIAGDDRMQDSC
jgi:hypothetical protein